MATGKRLVFLVEDDQRLASLVSQYLEGSGYRVRIAEFHAEVVPQIERAAPDLVILDLGLPNEDGLTICRQLRPSNPVPILMLTARDNDIDHVLGLEVGADDYVIKPIKPQVLLARINALLRRGQADSRDSQKLLKFGVLSIDMVARKVTLDGRAVALSSSEFDLLTYLAAHAGEIRSREEIFKALLRREYDGMDRVMDIRISHLRRKLGDDAGERIKTIWAQGYLFVPTSW